MVYAGGFFSITYMQEMTSAICNSATTPSATATASDTVGNKQGNTAYVPERTLIDNRDGKTYLVRKLADGNCWMAQNLDLDLSTSKTLTSNDTNLTTKSSYKPSYNTETDNSVHWGDLAGLLSDRSYNPGNVYYISARTTNSSSTSGQPYQHAGNYYSWRAATAATMTSFSLSTTVNNSICARGWRLPSPTDTNKSGQAIINKYSLSPTSTKRIIDFPFNYIYAGARQANGVISHIGNADNYGFYWENQTTNSDGHARDLTFSGVNSVITSEANHATGFGFSVRCVNV